MMSSENSGRGASLVQESFREASVCFRDPGQMLGNMHSCCESCCGHVGIMLRGGGHSVLTQSCCNHVASELGDVFLLHFLSFSMFCLCFPYTFIMSSCVFLKVS